jgi:hypothetical protein
MKSSTAVAVRSRGIGGKARRKEQPEGAWIRTPHKLDIECEWEDSGDEDYVQQDDDENDVEDEMTAQVRLSHCLRALPADFFTSVEARMNMELSSRRRPRGARSGGWALRTIRRLSPSLHKIRIASTPPGPRKLPGSIIFI